MIFLLTMLVTLLAEALSSAPTQPDHGYYNPLAPQIPAFAHHGMIIDAGSGGSRLHIFQWEPRIFDTAPPPISVPTDYEVWTDVERPGIASYADKPDSVVKHLVPLIEFAKLELANFADRWQYFPIYLKATGGMRLVPYSKRERLMTSIRNVFYNTSLNPFFFQYDFARVISGEEEAVYSWAGANFLTGTLLPGIEGYGTAIPPNGTFGTLDLGGASTQIAFYLPTQDISEGLFKLQIGSQRHWNVYAVSYLDFGHVSARGRYFNAVIENKISTNPKQSDPKKDKEKCSKSHPCDVTSPCLPSGYKEVVAYNDTRAGRMASYSVSGPDKPYKKQMSDCIETVAPLMLKSLNSFCNKVYDNQCSIGGLYQPPLPKSNFVGSSSYIYAWNFVQMPQTGSLKEFREKSENICKMSYSDLYKYRNSINTTAFPQQSKSASSDSLLPYYCFLSAYVLELVRNGYGFSEESVLMVTSTMNGHKMGWPMGAMLYEINALPWRYSGPNCTAPIVPPPAAQRAIPALVQQSGLVMTVFAVIGGITVILAIGNWITPFVLRKLERSRRSSSVQTGSTAEKKPLIHAADRL